MEDSMHNGTGRLRLCFMLPVFVAGMMMTLPATAAPLPDPVYSMPAAGGEQAVVFAGGCFWGVQAVFQHVRGVKSAISGYSGGKAETASYKTVSTGTTGHAESVKVTYDPAQVTFGQLMQVFFSAAHDPTELNRQGPDRGTQYRSEIFFTTPEQEKAAKAYIAQLDSAGLFGRPVVTKLEPLQDFYPAEDYHQNYAALHPDNPYIAINDAPKLRALQKDYPGLYISSDH